MAEDHAALVARGTRARPRVLAVASIGGHWEQLMLLRPALAEFNTVYATSNAELARRDGLDDVHVLPDTNRHQPRSALRCLFVAIRVVRKVRPDIVVTTGAAPGFMCIFAGWLIGARTLWIDSVANAERLSYGGRLARHLASDVISQWEHVAAEAGVRFEGRVL